MTHFEEMVWASTFGAARAGGDTLHALNVADQSVLDLRRAASTSDRGLHDCLPTREGNIPPPGAHR